VWKLSVAKLNRRGFIMFSQKVGKLFIVFMIFAMLNMMVGCNVDRATDTANDLGEPSLLTARSEQDDQSVGSDYFRTPTDRIGGNVIDSLVNLSHLQPYLEDFSSLGYSYSRQYSFVEEAYGVPEWSTDSVLVRFITLAMVYAPDTMRQAAYIMYVESELGFVIAPYVLSFVPPEPYGDFHYITECVWQLDYPIEVYRAVNSIKGSSSPTACSIFKFLDCWRENTAAVCAGALILCGVTGPGYPECVAAGCGGAALGSAVGCAFSTWK
jgi:hypothetical protein